MDKFTHPLQALMECVKEVPSYAEWEKLDQEENAKLEAQRIAWYKEHNKGFGTGTFRSLFEAGEGKEPIVKTSIDTAKWGTGWGDKREPFNNRVNQTVNHIKTTAPKNGATYVVAVGEGKGATPELAKQTAIENAKNRIQKLTGFKPSTVPPPDVPDAITRESNWENHGRGQKGKPTEWKSMIIVKGRVTDNQQVVNWLTTTGSEQTRAEQGVADPGNQPKQETPATPVTPNASVQSVAEDIAKQVGGTVTRSKSGYPAIQKGGTFVTFIEKNGTVSFANLNNGTFEPKITYGTMPELVAKKEEIVKRITDMAARVGARVKAPAQTAPASASTDNTTAAVPATTPASQPTTALNAEIDNQIAKLQGILPGAQYAADIEDLRKNLKASANTGDRSRAINSFINYHTGSQSTADANQKQKLKVWLSNFGGAKGALYTSSAN